MFGGEPKLEVVDANTLCQEALRSIVYHSGVKPIVSMGAMKSSNFIAHTDGAVFAPKDVPKNTSATEEDVAKTIGEVEDIAQESISALDGSDANSESGAHGKEEADSCSIILARDQLVSLPGITEENVSAVMKDIGNDLLSLLEASNADLRKVGVSASYIRRFRAALRKI